MQLRGNILKIKYPKVTVLRGVKHNVSLLFNDVLKIPIVNQIIRYHKEIYNLVQYIIYNNSQYI